MTTSHIAGGNKPDCAVKSKLVGKISFREALRLLLSVEAALQHDEKIRTELPAIISHWLQDPKQNPPMLNAGTDLRWKKALACYSRVGLRLPLESPELAIKQGVSIDFSDIPFPPIERPKFTFIDLFAGIGGFRIALQENGGKCLFSSEWDKAARETYFRNYGEVPFGDIRQFTAEGISDSEIKRLIPDHDILAAGFPCQPFSRAGVSARESLGKAHGFGCEIQGTLFFDIVRIVKAKRPRVLLLENVQNLRSHDLGRTFATIKKTIIEDLGYSFADEVIDASAIVPQKRKRCYIVCLRDPIQEFKFPEFKGAAKVLRDVLESNVPAKYTISDRLWNGHINRSARNVERGTGFTAYEANLDKPSNTLVARYGKDGKECLIPQKGKNPRKLTPRECARLQGFPEHFILPDSDSPAYRQFGNSIAVPVVKLIARSLLNQVIEKNHFTQQIKLLEKAAVYRASKKSLSDELLD